MGEIIHLQFGQCGNQLGDKFWSLLREEHLLDTKGKLQDNAPAYVCQHMGVFFNESANNKFVPRALLVDLEPGVLDAIKSGSHGSFFRPDNYQCTQSGAGGNWAKGHYTEGAELADAAMDCIRREVERTDCLHGFQILHSISGGTGSGMATLILSKLREEYPDRMAWTYSAAGSTRGGGSPAIGYNNILALHQLTENADTVVFFEDNAAFSLTWKHHIQPATKHLNALWSTIMSDITSGMRFPAHGRSDLRKISLNLVPFPRVHFMAVATAPLSANRLNNVKETVMPKDLPSQLFDRENMILSKERALVGGKHMAASCFFRGNISKLEVDNQMAEMQNKYSSSFVEWIPDNVKTTLCSVPPVHLNMSGTAVINTTAIIDTFQWNADSFNAMFKRKAFLHWFTGEGMDEMEFTEAIANVEDLIAEYQQYQDATVNENMNSRLYGSDDEVE